MKKKRIGEAYNRFVAGKIRRCGPPYFTKYFHFLGRAIDEGYPLNLDAKIARSLEVLLITIGHKNELGRYAKVIRDGRKRIINVLPGRKEYME